MVRKLAEEHRGPRVGHRFGQDVAIMLIMTTVLIRPKFLSFFFDGINNQGCGSGVLELNAKPDFWVSNV